MHHTCNIGHTKYKQSKNTQTIQKDNQSHPIKKRKTMRMKTGAREGYAVPASCRTTTMLLILCCTPLSIFLYNQNIIYFNTFLACESGKFGRQCSTNCHCVNQPCDHITGVCPPGGCKRGYKNSNCSTGM